MSTLRRSSRLAAKANNAPVVAPAVVPPVAPAVAVTAAPAVVNQESSSTNNKKNMIVLTIKNYLESVEHAPSSFAKVKVCIDLFKFLDEHFEFINTEAFHPTKQFVLTVHRKTIELQRDVNKEIDFGTRAPDSANFWDNEHHVYNQALTLFQRVHTKCHLYGMDKFVLADPIYKKFVETYMNNFL